MRHFALPVGARATRASVRGVLAGATTSLPQARVADIVVSRLKGHKKNAVKSEAAVPLVCEQAVSPACEDEARERCIKMYDMLEKPICLPSWFAFLRQLQRIEMEWRLEPGVSGTYVFALKDHTCTHAPEIVQLRGSGAHCRPIADMFECCVHLVQGTCSEKNVSFDDGCGCRQVLTVAAKHFLPDKDTANEPPKPRAGLAQFDCRGSLVSLSLLDSSTRLVTPLISDVSMQTFLYAFLTSLPIFLKRTDVGIRNAEFVSSEQMRHFRFAWCFLRREAFMTPLEMGELDNLIPP